MNHQLTRALLLITSKFKHSNEAKKSQFPSCQFLSFSKVYLQALILSGVLGFFWNIAEKNVPSKISSFLPVKKIAKNIRPPKEIVRIKTVKNFQWWNPYVKVILDMFGDISRSTCICIPQRRIQNPFKHLRWSFFGKIVNYFQPFIIFT